ncbi:MAG: hypothetical protein Q7S28_02295 [bacterium]|nr:hypothetical protein [bacterium]
MKVGDKVVCVNDLFHSRFTDPFTVGQLNLPKKGQLYTVREAVEATDGSAILLEEIINSKFIYDIGGLREPAFSTERFRKDDK